MGLAGKASTDDEGLQALRGYRRIDRRISREVKVGDVVVGGGARVSVQSMTNTLTHDVGATVSQIERCVERGADIMRVSCPDEASSLALKEIVREVEVPIVADIHFHYRRGLEAADAGAACLRINPGNIGSDERVGEVVRAARANGCSIRIGVNAGSLERDLLEKYREPCPEALLESALRHIRILESHNFEDVKISIKASDVQLCRASYRLLAGACDYPLHVGLTEAGGFLAGSIRSSMLIGGLLEEGIGDTIRVSLASAPEDEVKVGFEILKGLGLRMRGVRVVACPSCARQQFDVLETVRLLEERLDHITKPLTVSVVGCVVNGPGEARLTDLGITGGGKGVHQMYIQGVASHRLQSDNEEVVDHLVRLIEEKLSEDGEGEKRA